MIGDLFEFFISGVLFLGSKKLHSIYETGETNEYEEVKKCGLGMSNGWKAC